MNIQKWAPWNWFKHEHEEEGRVPVQRDAQGGQTASSNLPAQFANDPIWNIHREIDRMFDQAFQNFGGGFGTRLPSLFEGSSALSNLSGAMLKPNVDISESKKDYRISVEVPGVEEGDIKLELANGALTISGEKKQEHEQKDEHYHRVERSYGSFRRVISLPQDANEENIDAKFKNGLLTITVPRKQIAKTDDTAKVIDIKKAA